MFYPAREIRFEKYLHEVIFKTVGVKPATTFAFSPSQCHVVSSIEIPDDAGPLLNIEFSVAPKLAAIISRNCIIAVNGKNYKCWVERELMLCENCLQFGHLADNCKSPARCSHCAGEHNRMHCTKVRSPVRCWNCQDNKRRLLPSDHSPFYRKCPMRIQKQLESGAT